MTKRKSKKRTYKDAFDKTKMPNVRKEVIDYNKDDLLWIMQNGGNLDDVKELAKFVEEYYGAAVAKVTLKNGQRRVKRGHMHSTNELANDVYKRNNDRNNDLYGVTKINGLLEFKDLTDDALRKVYNADLTEASAVATIDNKKTEEDILTREEFEELKDNLTPEMLLFYMAYYDLD